MGHRTQRSKLLKAVEYPLTFWAIWASSQPPFCACRGCPSPGTSRRVAVRHPNPFCELDPAPLMAVQDPIHVYLIWCVLGGGGGGGSGGAELSIYNLRNGLSATMNQHRRRRNFFQGENGQKWLETLSLNTRHMMAFLDPSLCRFLCLRKFGVASSDVSVRV